MKIKELALCMENCDKITFKGKWIGEFIVRDITTSVERVAANYIGKVNRASTIAIEIASEGQELYDTFLTNFERIIECNDIAQIRFTLTDGQEYQIYVPWGNPASLENKNQITYLSDLGNLYIVISEDKTFDDFFNKKIINDRRRMEQIYQAYHIGKEE